MQVDISTWVLVWLSLLEFSQQWLILDDLTQNLIRLKNWTPRLDVCSNSKFVRKLGANFKERKGSSNVFHQQNIVMFHHPDWQTKHHPDRQTMITFSIIPPKHEHRVEKYSRLCRSTYTFLEQFNLDVLPTAIWIGQISIIRKIKKKL